MEFFEKYSDLPFDAQVDKYKEWVNNKGKTIIGKTLKEIFKNSSIKGKSCLETKGKIIGIKIAAAKLLNMM